MCILPIHTFCSELISATGFERTPYKKKLAEARQEKERLSKALQALFDVNRPDAGTAAGTPSQEELQDLTEKLKSTPEQLGCSQSDFDQVKNYVETIDNAAKQEQAARETREAKIKECFETIPKAFQSSKRRKVGTAADTDGDQTSVEITADASETDIRKAAKVLLEQASRAAASAGAAPAEAASMQCG